MAPIVLVCSVQLEVEPLLRFTAPVERLPSPRLTAWEARLSGRPILVLVAGMGKTNAAHALTVLLERREISGIIGFGIAGAYHGSGLRVGDVAVASAEHYGDEGVEGPQGWISCKGMGIPLIDSDARRYYNDLPVNASALAAARAALRKAGIRSSEGPFVTVSSCSGTLERGAELHGRYAALCETMEGAAYAHVAALYEIPFLELRGVSNLVEDRDTSRWMLREAADAAAAALPPIVGAWPFEPGPDEAEQS
ncbi:MAG: futalosine hydrolase [Gemmatimonadota bacterium]